MADLWRGMKKFMAEIYPPKRARFKWLAERNVPKVLVITCADGRITPCHKFDAEAGDVFTLRVAGNIVPPYGLQGGEEASIVLAVRLGVSEIFVMGHTDCGAMKGLLNPQMVAGMPAMKRMLQCSGTCASWVDGIKGTRQKLRVLTEKHIVQQIRNLESYPQVKTAVDAGQIAIHGVLFDIATGRFLRYNPATSQFVDVELDILVDGSSNKTA